MVQQLRNLSSSKEKIQSQDSNYKRKFILKIAEVEVSGTRNELRKQVTGAKEGPLEQRRKRGKGNVPGG